MSFVNKQRVHLNSNSEANPVLAESNQGEGDLF